jgi:hypothetical protein
MPSPRLASSAVPEAMPPGAIKIAAIRADAAAKPVILRARIELVTLVDMSFLLAYGYS